jgi:hypothetical protein
MIFAVGREQKELKLAITKAQSKLIAGFVEIPKNVLYDI